MKVISPYKCSLAHTELLATREFCPLLPISTKLRQVPHLSPGMPGVVSRRTTLPLSSFSPLPRMRPVTGQVPGYSANTTAVTAFCLSPGSRGSPEICTAFACTHFAIERPKSKKRKGYEMDLCSDTA